MKTLVVGGSGFLGGSIVEAARAAGHDVTILCRNPPGRAGVHHIAVNRLRSMAALPAADFDYVFDTCAYTPGAVGHVLDWVADRVRRYVLVSSISVYRNCARPPIEGDAVPDATDKDLAIARDFEASANFAAFGDWSSYGHLKRACELQAERMLASRAITLRAGLLIGPGDTTDRLTWWVRRIDQGGIVPVPGPPARPVQLIDARDVAAFALRLATAGRSGIYNTTSRPFAMGTLLETIAACCPNPATPHWIDEQRFTAAKIAPWTEVPYWLPASEDTRHFLDVNVARALADGLSTRPLQNSVSDVLTWDRTRRDVKLACGMSAAQEQALLS